MLIIGTFFVLEVYSLNSTWGLFSDWDIYIYPVFLAVILCLRIFELNCTNLNTWKQFTGAIIPLSVGHLIVWTVALHSNDYIHQRMVENNKYPRNEKLWYSAISTYEIGINSISPAIAQLIDQDEDLRMMILYNLLGKKPSDNIYYIEDSVKVENVVKDLVKTYEDKLSIIDLNNLATFYMEKDKDTALYFSRKAANIFKEQNPGKEFGDIFITATVGNLAAYYNKSGYASAAILYASLLPGTDIEGIV